MQQPLISVIIPTYERPQFIIKACMTAYNQTYKNIEIIVIDDHSMASYENYFDEFSKLNVKYIKRDTNGGGSAARNSGIEKASGKYVAFLDDDDIWMESKLEKQINSLTDEIRASHCGYSLKSNNKTRIEAKNIITLDDLRENNKLASTSGLLCETKLLQQTMFDSSLHRSQDWDIYLRIAQFTSFSYIQEPLYIYDDGDHARMSNRFSQLTIEEFKLKLDMLKKHRATLKPSAYRDHIAALILPSIKLRSDKLTILNFCISEIGVLSTVKHLTNLVLRKFSNYLNR